MRGTSDHDAVERVITMAWRTQRATRKSLTQQEWVSGEPHFRQLEPARRVVAAG
jgi:hypothetical protein